LEEVILSAEGANCYPSKPHYFLPTHISSVLPEISCNVKRVWGTKVT